MAKLFPRKVAGWDHFFLGLAGLAGRIEAIAGRFRSLTHRTVGGCR
ncbi:hypothetical protein [Cryobacterium sp. Hb1]|nr:hypothetical protein [Cryobacterium sp. Hb1]